jgi:hypothetical protein
LLVDRSPSEPHRQPPRDTHISSPPPPLS